MTARSVRVACLAAIGLLAAAPAFAAGKAPPTPRQQAWRALATLPDWTEGVWQIDWAALFAPGGRPTPPALTPEYAAKFKAYQDSQARGENVQNQNANCLPPGVPQIMQMPYPLEFNYTPGRVTIVIETDSQVRHVYTDGRKHPDDPDLTFNGDSIGHWEGDTLVIDTVGLEPHTEIAAGVGHSDKVHIVERIRQTSPDHLEIATTITDPAVLTAPWTVVRPYIHHTGWQIQEYVCEQNNHDSADAEGRPGFRLDDDKFGPPAPAPTPAPAK